jgi:hypothetical protein
VRIALIGQVSNVQALRSLCERCAALDVDQIFYVGGQSEIREQIPAERARVDHEENAEDVWTLAGHCANAELETIRSGADQIRRRNALLALVDLGDAPSLHFRSPSNLHFALCAELDSSEPSSPSSTDVTREPDSTRANVIVMGDAETWAVEERGGVVFLTPGRHAAGSLMVIDDAGGSSTPELTAEVYDQSGSYLARSSVALGAARQPLGATETPRDVS